jgi:hypothetical protein
MIDVKDIRVGNWFIYRSWEDCINDTGDYKDIYTQILPDDFEDLGLNNKWAQKHSGIPITIDLLKVCGIEFQDDNPKQKPQYDGDIIFKILDFEFTNSQIEGFRCYEINGGKTIYKYLHQLQNLFYILSGTELTVPLETEQEA